MAAGDDGEGTHQGRVAAGRGGEEEEDVTIVSVTPSRPTPAARKRGRGAEGPPGEGDHGLPLGGPPVTSPASPDPLLMGALGHSLDVVSGRIQPVSSTLRRGDTPVLPPAPQAPAPLVPGGFQKPATPVEQAAIQAAVTKAWVEHQGRGRGASPTRGTPRPARGRSTGSPRRGRTTPRLQPLIPAPPLFAYPAPQGAAAPDLALPAPSGTRVGHPRGSRGETPLGGSPRETEWPGGIPGVPTLRWSGPPLTASSRRPTNSWLQWGGGMSLLGTMSTTRTTPNGLTRPNQCGFPAPSRGAPRYFLSTSTLRGTSSVSTLGAGPPHYATAPREHLTALQSSRTTWT